MFNKETEYALRGLVYIKLQNLKGRRPGTVEIAKEIEAPHFFTAKILQRIVRVGLLKSYKGKNGGFFFDEHSAVPPIITSPVSRWCCNRALRGTLWPILGILERNLESPESPPVSMAA